MNGRVQAARAAHEKPEHFTLDEVVVLLRHMQERRIYGTIELTLRDGNITYLHHSRGLKPGERWDHERD